MIIAQLDAVKQKGVAALNDDKHKGRSSGILPRIPGIARMFCRLGAVAALVLLVAGSPASADGARDVVLLRQKEMKEIASAAKVIAGMFKMPETYSSSLFEKAARGISERADKRLLDGFETIVAAENSKASAAIFTDRDRFAELARDLKRYADALAEAAKQHPGEMTDEMRMKDGELMEGGILGSRRKTRTSDMSAEHLFHMMLQTCTSCHSSFRRTASVATRNRGAGHPAKADTGSVRAIFCDALSKALSLCQSRKQ